MKKKLLIASLALVSSTSMATNIALDDGKNVTINGFANIVAGQTLDKDEVFLAEPIAGGVYDNELTFNKESIFGLKSTVSFSNKLSFTGQMIARSANDFNVELDRAYVDYQINQNWKVSAGKKNLIFFQYSDYLDVVQWRFGWKSKLELCLLVLWQHRKLPNHKNLRRKERPQDNPKQLLVRNLNHPHPSGPPFNTKPLTPKIIRMRRVNCRLPARPMRWRGYMRWV